MTTPIKLPPPMCRCGTCMYWKPNQGYKPPAATGTCRRDAPHGGDDEPAGRVAPVESWCGRWLGLRKKGHEVVLLNYPTACELWANGKLAEGEVS